MSAGKRIIIMPGGGVARNLKRIAARVPLKEVHLSATKGIESAMEYRNERVFMGGTLRPSEWTRAVTDAAKVRAMRNR